MDMNVSTSLGYLVPVPAEENCSESMKFNTLHGSYCELLTTLRPQIYHRTQLSFRLQTTAGTDCMESHYVVPRSVESLHIVVVMEDNIIIINYCRF